MELGRRIYFDVETGNVILDKGEMVGFLIEKSVEQDILDFKVLSERNRETFDVLQLEYGAYSQDFVESNGYKVNVVTMSIEFSYPNPNEPEAPEVYEKPLTEQIIENTTYLVDVDYRLSLIELGLN